MEPLTPLETLCRIILRAKEYEAQVPTDYDGERGRRQCRRRGRGKRCRSSRTSINDSVEEELTGARSTISPTTSWPKCWPSPGSATAPMTPADWDEAFEEASGIEDQQSIDELMDMPMLASVLEAGLAAFDLSCDGIGDLS